MTTIDLAIVGAGVAGLGAGIAARRQGIAAKVFDSMGPGGQLINAGELDFLPGYGSGTRGADLIGKLTDELLGDQVDLEFGTVESISGQAGDFLLTVDGAAVHARRIVLAMGGRHRRLEVPGEAELEGRGVSDCAICDGAMFSGKRVVVVGGGDKACESAAYLATICASVTVVHRGDRFDGVAALTDQLAELSNVQTRLRSTITAIHGREKLDSITVKDDGVPEESTLASDGLFLAIGSTPATEFLVDFVRLSDHGLIVADKYLESSVPGVYRAGAARAGHSGQLASAIGEGVAAGMTAGRSLQWEATLAG